MLKPLNFPKANLKLTRKGEVIYVWDIFRKRKLIVTPEEWVRQHVLHYLIDHKSIPASLIASEYGIEVNKLTRRCDGVVFDRSGKPIMIIECKAPEIKINEQTLHQIAQYNFSLKVNWLVLTNGIDTVVAFVNADNKSIDYIREIPSYEDLHI